MAAGAAYRARMAGLAPGGMELCVWGGGGVHRCYHVYLLYYIILYHVHLYSDQLLYEYMTCLVSCIVINGHEMR
jgi:hypothetical protein